MTDRRFQLSELVSVSLLLTVGASAWSADDCVGESCDETQETAAPFFSEASNHPGLLGKSYLDLRYHQIEPSDLGFATTLFDPFQGMILSSNTPLPPLDELPGPFRYDFYVETHFLHLDGTGFLPFRRDPVVPIEAHSSSLDFALTAYVDEFETARPFIQFGVSFRRDWERLTINQTVLIFDRSRTALLANVGCEFDLMDRLALRTQIDLNTDDEFDRSLGSLELIWWPLRRVYFRGGMFGPLDASSVGGLIGAGVVF